MNGHICPIKKMERLLLATDGTETSQGAVPFVIAQAEKDMRQKIEAVKTMAKEAGINCDIIIHRGSIRIRI